MSAMLTVLDFTRVVQAVKALQPTIVPPEAREAASITFGRVLVTDMVQNRVALLRKAMWTTLVFTDKAPVVEQTFAASVNNKLPNIVRVYTRFRGYKTLFHAYLS